MSELDYFIFPQCYIHLLFCAAQCKGVVSLYRVYLKQEQQDQPLADKLMKEDWHKKDWLVFDQQKSEIFLFGLRIFKLQKCGFVVSAFFLQVGFLSKQKNIK